VQPARADPRVIARNAGTVYADAWRSAIGEPFHPEWVLITSWNEWFEGSQIEPSATYGDLYLNLTRQYVTQWKGASPVPPAALPPSPQPTMPPAPNSRTFPETGHTVEGPFLTYWETRGGLAQFGYPVSEEMQEQSDLDGKTYTVQYFERVVLERH